MKELTRRGLFAAGAAGVVAGILGQAPSAEATRRRPKRERRRRKKNRYARGRYQRLLGRRFKLAGATGATGVTLVGVSDLPSGRAGDNNCFALTFRSARPGPPQGTYTLRRRGFAPTSLFVVPGDPNRSTYLAVINRSR